MKTSFLGFVLILAATAALSAAEVPVSSPQAAYEQAVKSYVDAAGSELTAIRTQVDSQVGTPPDEAKKKRLAKTYDQLEQSDKMLAELKKTGPADFDKIKARFEQTRAELLKTFEAARKG